MKDEVIQEVWRAKDSVAARHNHSVAELARYLQEKDRDTSTPVVDLHVRRSTTSQSAK